MANATDPLAATVHGSNPQVRKLLFSCLKYVKYGFRAHAVRLIRSQNLVEKIIRMKVYNTTFWKESCFGLTGASNVTLPVEYDVNSEP